MMPSPLGGPRSVVRVLQVLAAVANQPLGMTLSALAQSLALPKTTLHTMLKVMVGARYLVLTDNRFRVGERGLALGAAIVGTPRAFPECIQGILEDLAERTGETALCSELTPDRRSCRYIASAETKNWLRFSVPVGSLRDAHATGSGQAMLAFLSPKALQQALADLRWSRITPQTVASRSALLRSLERVRQRGVSTVHGGTVAGVTSVAAPIFDASGVCIAALSLGGPSSRLERQLETLEHIAIEAAQQASRLMGFTGTWPPTLRTRKARVR